MTVQEELLFHREINAKMRLSLANIQDRVEKLYNHKPFFEDILHKVQAIDIHANLSVLPYTLAAVIYTDRLKDVKQELEKANCYRFVPDGEYGFWLIDEAKMTSVKIRIRPEEGL